MPAPSSDDPAARETVPAGAAPRRESDPDRETILDERRAVLGSEIPSSFGDYEELVSIASGGMGIVFRARSRSLGRMVAIKVLKGSPEMPEILRSRFQQEARAVARLSHPGVVRILEAGQVNGLPFLAMEFVEGASLRECCRGGGLSLEGRLEIFRRILEAVVYIHGQGVIHRDLKPENVLVDGAFQPRLMDFGLARIVGPDTRITQAGTAFGTPLYMSPEQIEGDPQGVDHRTDIYSLGVLLYELLTDRPPYTANTMFGIYSQISRSTVDLPSRICPEISPEMEAVCLGAFARKREDRPQTAGEFLAAFDEAVAAAGGTWRRRWLVLGQAWQRNRALRFSAIATGVVLGLSAVTAVVLATLPERDGPEQEGPVREDGPPRSDPEEAARAFAGEARALALAALERGEFERAASEARRALEALPGDPRAEELAAAARFFLELAAATRSADGGLVADAVRRLGEAPLPPRAAVAFLAALESVERVTPRNSFAVLAGVPEAATALGSAVLDLLPEPGADVAAVGRWLILLKAWPVLSRLVAGLVDREGTDLEARLWMVGELAVLAPQGALARVVDEVPAEGREAVRAKLRGGVAWYLDLAKRGEEKKQYEEAIGCLARALLLDPESVPAHATLARCLVALARREEALAVYGKLVLLDPAHAHEHTNERGLLLRDLGRREEAEAEYAESIRSAPREFILCYGNRALVRYDRHAYDEALADLDHGIEVAPNAFLYWLRALVYARQGRWAEAEADLGSVQGGKHDSCYALHGRTLLELARGNPPAALAAARELVALKHDHWRDTVAHGLALVASGDFAAGGKELRSVAQAKILYDRDLYYRALGRVAEAEGNRALARSLYERARADNPALPGIEEDLARVR
ncbi:MAG: protein kinase [Planctomycetes bacterium]|nr:protein kinase [Planctomycetota bacterium]